MRAEAQAYLVHHVEMGLQQAVDVLQHAADTSGLVALIGQDALKAIMSDACKAVRP